MNGPVPQQRYAFQQIDNILFFRQSTNRVHASLRASAGSKSASNIFTFISRKVIGLQAVAKIIHRAEVYVFSALRPIRDRYGAGR